MLKAGKLTAGKTDRLGIHSEEEADPNIQK